jgi:hypothetical protein
MENENRVHEGNKEQVRVCTDSGPWRVMVFKATR